MFIAIQQEASTGNYKKGRSMDDLEKAIETAKGWADSKNSAKVMMGEEQIWHSYVHGEQEPHPHEEEAEPET